MSAPLDEPALRRVFGSEVRAALAAPVDAARGLPNEAFTSQEFFRLEQRRLFARTWVFAGRAGDMSAAGDVCPVEVAGRPLVLVRDRDGEVRAFHNVCPHRGARLVCEPEHGRAVLTCPYHAWTYGLDGGLRSRPHYHGPDRHDPAGDDRVSLFRAPCVVWHDWIFVNPDGGA
jgi:choline monooxygenase